MPYQQTAVAFGAQTDPSGPGGQILPATFQYVVASVWVWLEFENSLPNFGMFDGNTAQGNFASVSHIQPFSKFIGLNWSNTFPSGFSNFINLGSFSCPDALAETWVNILISIDSVNGTFQCALNDALQTFTASIPVTPTLGQMTCTSNETFGTTAICQADFWMAATNTFYDLSIESNRRAFISSGGFPADLGDDGSATTGIHPAIYLSVRDPGDSLDTFLTNRGTFGTTLVKFNDLSPCVHPPPAPPAPTGPYNWMAATIDIPAAATSVLNDPSNPLRLNGLQLQFLQQSNYLLANYGATLSEETALTTDPPTAAASWNGQMATSDVFWDSGNVYAFTAAVTYPSAISATALLSTADVLGFSSGTTAEYSPQPVMWEDEQYLILYARSQPDAEPRMLLGKADGTISWKTIWSGGSASGSANAPLWYPDEGDGNNFVLQGGDGSTVRPTLGLIPSAALGAETYSDLTLDTTMYDTAFRDIAAASGPNTPLGQTVPGGWLFPTNGGYFIFLAKDASFYDIYKFTGADLIAEQILTNAAGMFKATNSRMFLTALNVPFLIVPPDTAMVNAPDITVLSYPPAPPIIPGGTPERIPMPPIPPSVVPPVVIPLQPIPSQTVTVTLANQQCTINVRQTSTGIFLDLLVNDELIIGGVLCQNLNPIVRNVYLGFIGDLAFYDTQPSTLLGPSDPIYTGLGSRFVLEYYQDAP